MKVIASPLVLILVIVLFLLLSKRKKRLPDAVSTEGQPAQNVVD